MQRSYQRGTYLHYSFAKYTLELFHARCIKTFSKGCLVCIACSHHWDCCRLRCMTLPHTLRCSGAKRLDALFDLRKSLTSPTTTALRNKQTNDEWVKWTVPKTVKPVHEFYSRIVCRKKFDCFQIRWKLLAGSCSLTWNAFILNLCWSHSHFKTVFVSWGCIFSFDLFQGCIMPIVGTKNVGSRHCAKSASWIVNLSIC